MMCSWIEHVDESLYVDRIVLHSGRSHVRPLAARTFLLLRGTPNILPFVDPLMSRGSFGGRCLPFEARHRWTRGTGSNVAS